MNEKKCVAFAELIEVFRAYPRIIVQAHDFPDHDAISSAYAMSYLLKTMGISTEMVYSGLIDRISIHRMIEQLDIDIHPARECDLHEDDKTIVVDGCIGEKNVTDLVGDEVAVIDHHHVEPGDALWFSDVRPEYGATATIMVEYFQYFSIPMPRSVATALQIGLNIDTANLTRGFCQADVAAFAYLHQIADQELVNRICRNSLEANELQYYQHLLSHMSIVDNIAVAQLPEDCPKNLLGILGDFLIAVDKIDVTVLSCTKPEVLQLSLRSEIPTINVADAARRLLTEQAIGFGGGHAHMAGGIVHRNKLPAAGDHGRYIFDLFLADFI